MRESRLPPDELIYGKRIKFYMKKFTRFKQSDLCVRMGIRKSKLSEMLSGLIRISLKDYQAICEALGVCYDTFFSDEWDGQIGWEEYLKSEKQKSRSEAATTERQNKKELYSKGDYNP